MLNDFRFALRLLLKHRGFTAVAVLALAIGIGANSAIFSVVHAVLLEPLPYPAADRVVDVTELAQGRPSTVSPPNFYDWKERTRTVERLAAYQERNLNLSGIGEPERLPAAAVHADLFAALGVSAALGRVFEPADEQAGRERVVLIGHALWQRRFAADPGIIGRFVTVDGAPHEVVGVLPRQVAFPLDADLWVPLVTTPAELRPNQRGAHYWRAIARLKPGIAIEQAARDLNEIERALAASNPPVEGYSVAVTPLLESMVGEVRRPLWLLLGAVGFVLLIACANVSNLLLARATTRAGEIAVRAALGAGRGRIVRQLVAESVVLGIAGGLIGLLMAAWGVRSLEAALPADLPRASGIAVDGSVLVFSMVVAILTGVVFGLVPAFYAARADVTTFLKDARRDGASAGGRRRFRSALVAIEVALALVLLAGAGLALRTFARLSAVDPGFDPSNLLAVNLSLGEVKYRTPAERAGFFERFIPAVASQPGVISAGGVWVPPLLGRGGFGGTFNIVGQPEAPESLQVRPASPGYLETMRIPLRRGRTIENGDRDGALPIAVISESAARRFWPDQDPIGQRIRIHVGISGPDPVREIVGIVGDVRNRALNMPVRPTVYVPESQYVADSLTIFVRAAVDPRSLVASVKAQAAAIDPEVAVANVRTGRQLVAASVGQQQLRMTLLGVFASVALVLAAVGLYGVMAFSVSQRRSELGLRIALGADSRALLRLVMFQGLRPVAVGLVAGLAGAAVVTRATSELLFEVSPFDPATFAAVSLLLLSVAFAACYVPARRATRVDPLTAMRHE